MTAAQTRIILVALAVLVASLVWIFAPIFILQDLTIYWQASQAWFAGLNPYQLPHHSSYLTGQIGLWDRSTTALQVWAPPYFLTPSLVLLVFSLQSAKFLYISLSLLVVIYWLSAPCRGESTFLCLKSKIVRFILIFVTFPWGPWVGSFRWGGMSILSAIGVIALTRLRPTSSRVWYGLIFFLFMLKPHPAALTWITIMLAIRRPPIFWLLLAVVVSLLVPLVISSSIYSQFAQLSYEVPFRYLRQTQTLVGMLTVAGLAPTMVIAVGGLSYAAVVTLIFLACKRRPCAARNDSVMLGLLLTPVSVFLAPYSWGHDLIIASGWATSLFALRIVSPIGWLLIFPLIQAINLGVSGWVTGFVVPQLSACAWAAMSLALFWIWAAQPESDPSLKEA